MEGYSPSSLCSGSAEQLYHKNGQLLETPMYMKAGAKVWDGYRERRAPFLVWGLLLRHWKILLLLEQIALSHASQAQAQVQV